MRRHSRLPAESLIEQHFTTPLGPMMAVASERGLCVLGFVAHRDQAGRELGQLIRHTPRARLARGRNRHIDALGAWLGCYFTDGTCPPLTFDLRGTPFDRAVWQALLEIPLGQCLSYTDLARRLGRPRAARAVGNAVGRNPVVLAVPCHRVVAADGLGGYGGGLERKRWLLEHERACGNG